jgi:hypothetical protein
LPNTTASNLRLILAAAAGAAAGEAEHYLHKHRGRYQLATVEVDLWRLYDAWTQAQKTSSSGLATLRHACTAYTGDWRTGGFASRMDGGDAGPVRPTSLVYGSTFTYRTRW